MQELIKPLIDFKYEVIETRMNSMFELATQDEIDKLKGGGGETETDKSSEELQLDDLEVTIDLKVLKYLHCLKLLSSGS